MKFNQSDSMPKNITLTLTPSEANDALDALDWVINILSCTEQYAPLEEKMKNLHGWLWNAFFEQVVKVINADFYNKIQKISETKGDVE
ncbi:MAG: hypothetical protein PHF13_06300 [Acholeplasmataceae bacterium]|jgi:hypothetical protein|nr:hypothetical protein [Acholeplasmataceae bacterium]